MNVSASNHRKPVAKTLRNYLLQPVTRMAKLKITVLAGALFCIVPTAFSQTVLIEITGQVINHEKNEPLPDVSVQIKGSVTGTITDNTGNFTLRTKQKLPFTLVFSSVGYQQQELEVKSLGSKLQVAM